MLLLLPSAAAYFFFIVTSWCFPFSGTAADSEFDARSQLRQSF